MKNKNDASSQTATPGSENKSALAKQVSKVLALAIVASGSAGVDTVALAQLRNESGASFKIRSHSPVIDGILKDAQEKLELDAPPSKPNYDRDGGGSYDRAYDRTYDRQNEYDRVYDRQ